MSRARGGSALTTVSPMRIVPSLIDSRPASIRSEVVLPQPDGPSSTSISPFGDVEVQVVDGRDAAEALADVLEARPAPSALRRGAPIQARLPIIR